jgi:hypothetical protein
MSPNGRQLRLEMEEPRPEDPEAPLVYVASALTHLNEEGRQLVEAWCHIVRDTVVEVSGEADQKWRLRVHLPIAWSAPWNDPDERLPQEIYAQNARIVREEADALIVLGFGGGSLGAGQEFAWASGLRLPILYLRNKGQPMSRQISGTPADLETAEFETPEELVDAVAGFLRRNRGVIEDGPRRRRNRSTQFVQLSAVIRSAWEALGDHHRDEISGISRLDRRRIEELMQPMTLATATLDEVAALTAALGVDLGRAVAPASLPELDAAQLAALRTAATEYEWTGPTTLELLREARLELAKGGVRRLPLATPQDWANFKEAKRRGE